MFRGGPDFFFYTVLMYVAFPSCGSVWQLLRQKPFLFLQAGRRNPLDVLFGRKLEGQPNPPRVNTPDRRFLVRFNLRGDTFPW